MSDLKQGKDIERSSLKQRLIISLPICLRKNRYYRVFVIFTVVLALGLFQFPMLSGGWDLLFQLIGFFTMVIHVFIGGLTIILMKMDKELDYRKSRLMVSSALVVILLFNWSSRDFAEKRLLSNIDGVIIDKFQAGTSGVGIKVEGR